MALYVKTNISSINAMRNLNNVTQQLDTVYKRLSSGLRINSAKDDAAGLQIANRLTAQINGLNQGNRNTNDGIAMAQTMEGAMDEMTSMLQRIRTLTIQAANGTNNAKDREAIQQEVTQLSLEVTRIACQTKYGGEKVLAGVGGIINDKGQIQLQVGAYAGDTLTMTGFSLGYTLSMIADAASKKPAADGKSGLILENGISRFTVSTQSAASTALSAVDDLISVIDKQRAHLGAMQNRMESTIRNQSNTAMNLADARSRIRDTDYAEEAAKLSQLMIIQQAAASMLTQANQRPHLALMLLGG